MVEASRRTIWRQAVIAAKPAPAARRSSRLPSQQQRRHARVIAFEKMTRRRWFRISAIRGRAAQRNRIYAAESHRRRDGATGYKASDIDAD